MLSPESIQSTGNEISFVLTQLEEGDELDDSARYCCCGSLTVINKYIRNTLKSFICFVLRFTSIGRPAVNAI